MCAQGNRVGNILGQENEKVIQAGRPRLDERFLAQNLDIFRSPKLF
jgi:hypothetical protein